MDEKQQLKKKKIITDLVDQMIGDILLDIHELNLFSLKDINLNKEEIGLLYRWPIYVSVNTFLLKVFDTFEIKKCHNSITILEGCYPSKYFKSTVESVQFYYGNEQANQKLTSEIARIIKCPIKISNQLNNRKSAARHFNKFDEYILNVKKIVKSFFRPFYLFIYFTIHRILNRVFKPKIFFERHHVLGCIYRGAGLIVPPLREKKTLINKNLRGEIKNCFTNNFKKYGELLFPELMEFEIQELSIIFASWVDKILPKAIIEDLDQKINYYNQLISKISVKQVHAATGFYYNDNFKIFALLASKKKALLFAHDDGFMNFTMLYPEKENYINKYKDLNQIRYCNYYVASGIGPIDPMWDNIEKIFNIKILNIGSVYLSTLKKRKKIHILNDPITILYTARPLRTFNTSLEEISANDLLIHRQNTSLFLRRIIAKFPNVKVIYKPFPQTDLNDPLKIVLKNELQNKKLWITNKKPIELLPNIDIAFFDSISTGFMEAIQIQVPTIIYNLRSEYYSASDQGKKINDELEECGMVFYDERKGIRSFEKIIHDLPAFQRASREPIRQLQEAIAYPISKYEFKRNLENSITINMS